MLLLYYPRGFPRLIAIIVGFLLLIRLFLIGYVIIMSGGSIVVVSIRVFFRT